MRLPVILAVISGRIFGVTCRFRARLRGSMTEMMARLTGVVRDDRGHGLIELALITGSIVLTAIGAIASLAEG